MTGIVLFDTSTDADDAVKADRVCRVIGAALMKHYPRRQWYVDVSLKGGVAKIICPGISRKHGFVVHLEKTDMELEKSVVRAGGQILEMFKLSRDKGAVGGLETLLRDARGDALKAATGL